MIEPNMDAIKTREINVLVAENRTLITDRDSLLCLLEKAMGVVSEHGQITDESRIGWLMVEIDSALGKHGRTSESKPSSHGAARMGWAGTGPWINTICKACGCKIDHLGCGCNPHDA